MRKLPTPPRAIWFVRHDTGYYVVYDTTDTVEARKAGYQVTKFVPEKRDRVQSRRLPRVRVPR
ncbi:MAG: hypothetical protein ACYDDA_05000 [Acidiferrobacteraceae bacterium]